MSRRNKYDWPTLFQEFHHSGLSQAQFCSDRGMNAKYFSLCYAKHQREQQSNFTRAEVSPVKQQRSGVVLRLNHGELHFDVSVDPTYIASLIRAL